MPSGVPSILASISPGASMRVTSTVTLNLNFMYATLVSNTAVKCVGSISFSSLTPSTKPTNVRGSRIVLNTTSRGACTVNWPDTFMDYARPKLEPNESAYGAPRQSLCGDLGGVQCMELKRARASPARDRPSRRLVPDNSPDRTAWPTPRGSYALRFPGLPPADRRAAGRWPPPCG